MQASVGVELENGARDGAELGPVGADGHDTPSGGGNRADHRLTIRCF
jgi:hypothetical protein